MKKYDYLVIGSGIAGLTFAIEVSKFGKVALITKEKIIDCNTEFAQGGIAAVIDSKDSFEKHSEDTYIAGDRLGKKEVIRNIIKQGPELIEYLMKLGTNFTQKENSIDKNFENLSLTKEGGHSDKRVAYSADSTGHEIMRALSNAIKNHENIDIFENHTAIDLITQHHISEEQSFIPRITCWGAYVLDNLTGKIITFRAKKTLMATGGASQIFRNTTNPEVATGDGLAMSFLAGSRISNMEFIQFHPTTYYSPTEKTFLISEALRGEGAVLKLQNGQEFMHKYHKLKSLAPRDVVARAMETEMNKRGEKFIYLDARNVEKKKLLSHFPYINKKLLKRGIDFTKDMIPVVPGAHYFCGGIITTIDGITDIKNLRASGEVSCTGFHGANRLASNSLLESVVIGYRAAHHDSIKKSVDFPEIPEWNNVDHFNENEWVIISHNREIIRTIMQGYVGIIRSKRLLKYALNRINNIYTEINNFYNHNKVKREVIETRNIAIVSKLVIQAALKRKESRGLHFITDYPNKNKSLENKDTII